jgi:WD40 repeat protein
MLHELKGHSSDVVAVAVSPDGRHAVSGSSDTTAKLWDLERGDVVRTLQGHCAYVRGVAVSPGGSLAASVSFDWELKVWDLKTGIALAGFTCDGPAVCCAFATERMMLVGDATGQVHFLYLEFPVPN